jgi:hypothetical protein
MKLNDADFSIYLNGFSMSAILFLPLHRRYRFDLVRYIFQCDKEYGVPGRRYSSL